MQYEVTIDKFQGPLDLLLHLIRQSNISIEEISIDEITKQYFNYIKKMDELNLNIASEYLVMASELLEIKSKALLPKQESVENEDEEIFDSKEELINKLLEYEKYKNMTETFKELQEYRKEVFTKDPSNLSEFKDNNDKIDYGVSLDDLISALTVFLEKKEQKKPLNTKITKKEYSIEKRSLEIKKILMKKKKINFIDLFDNSSKEYIIITFLSILAMSKKQELEINQENNFKNIIIKEKVI